MLTREYRLPTYFGVSVVFRVVRVRYITWQSARDSWIGYAAAHITGKLIPMTALQSPHSDRKSQPDEGLQTDRALVIAPVEVLDLTVRS